TTPQLVVLERVAWMDDAITAAEVTSRQLFRDYFAAETLRLGQEINVGSLCVAFSDLRGSTALYLEPGDGRAFSTVIDHFTVLREEVSKEEGAIVKTIGDAVMAVFPRALPAVRAMVRAQRRLASADGPRPPLRLRAGVHCGACIAVTLNERLDYFGGMVN